MDVAGKVAIVTGAASSLDRAQRDTVRPWRRCIGDGRGRGVLADSAHRCDRLPYAR